MSKGRHVNDGKPLGSPITKGKHPGLTTKPADSEPGQGGRPEIVIDPIALYELAKTHASYEHMGRILGCSGTYLNNRMDYREIVEKARAEQKSNLLAAQFSAAITDRNPTMLIWMGKQFLEQKDVQRVENTGADGGPVKTETKYKAIAYFPENNRNKKLPAGTATVIEEDGSETPIEVELEEARPRRRKRRTA